jgi:RNA polymerase sigma-70 factor (ECF subfamily)
VQQDAERRAVLVSRRSEELARLAELHLPHLIAYLSRRASSLESAEDLAAETLAIACEKWARPSVKDDRLWLLGIARRVAADAYRKEKRGRSLSGDPSHQDDDSLPLRMAVDRLPANQREALILTAVEGFSAAEAARIMKRSPASVNSLVQRARARLSREWWEESR